MWPLPTIQNKWVSIEYEPAALTLSCIHTINTTTPYELVALQKIPLGNLELNGLIPYHQTAIMQSINQFLDTHNLKHAYVSCSLSGPTIFEKIIELPTASPNAEMCARAAQEQDTQVTFKHMNWDYQYLCQQENACSSFYVCGIQRQHLFHYQLLAMRTRMNLSVMTTQQLALFRLYKQLHGASFRSSQFAQDMRIHNNDLRSFFTPTLLNRMLRTNAHAITEHDVSHLSTLLGLYLLGQDSYDQH